MTDEDYPGLSLGLFYEQSLTDNTWTQHSEETYTINNCCIKLGCKAVTFSHQVQEIYYEHIPLLNISQSPGHLQAKKDQKPKQY